MTQICWFLRRHSVLHEANGGGQGKRFHIACLILGLAMPAIGVPHVSAADYDRVLFRTDFSDFTVGADAIAGVDGWECNHPATQSHGIVEDQLDGIGKSGYVGKVGPNEKWVSVSRSINYDQSGTDFSVMTFSISFAIFDSKNERYDSFHLSFFDSETNVIAAVVFDNTEQNYGVWRSDGKAFTRATSRRFPSSGRWNGS